ncbi:acetyl-hydrolase [Pyricularia oryzae 70-15]|uniref:Acetyl-hydrolase n=4 Tax=Pyricularia TaxID=48558 RepID=G4NCT6_PYRO7|nr:acetyl-hydrolase [Pyricularia oryzae 70-15]EHA48329.1 acetyl-hydrolase [Pyricularia oryzae 70-15]KAI7916192.1 acetyl-hydrolase [Pyricularia oryzae]
MGKVSNRVDMFLSAVSRLPLVVRVAILHMLHLSQQSKYLDLRTELSIAVMRSFVQDPKPRSISSTQKLLNKDPGVKGRIWVARYTSPAPPEVDVRDALLAAVEGLMDECLSAMAAAGPGGEGQQSAGKPVCRIPDLVPVEAEWTGYRASATSDSKLPSHLSERQRYDEMMKECTSPVTVLYFHGGAHYLMDPATHRHVTRKLAKLTGGRCYSVRYRLAPQNPFPAAVLDALVSYLTLLYPPPGAFHKAVKPEHIVFAGDSAGGNLCLALLQTILELNRQSREITWHGSTVSVPTPAGCAVNSPWMDMTLSSPSWKKNSKWDYLPSDDGLDDRRPSCAAWPATPPRRSIYVDDAMILHPLASPLAAANWAGSPPIYVCTGWELLADEDRLLAARLEQAGVPVVFEEYEAMPHCFALVFNHLEASRRCFDAWAGFIGKVIDGAEGDSGVEGKGNSVESSFTTVRAKTLEEVPIPTGELRKWSEEEVRERLVRRCQQLLPAIKGDDSGTLATPKL